MKKTLLLTLVITMTLTLTWCGQQSEPNIDRMGDTTMTGTVDNTGSDMATTMPTTDTATTTPDNTQTSDNTTTPPINTTVTTDTTVKSYTMAEVAQHNNEVSCRSVINGNVYDLTSFVTQHPGGDRNILKICGIDGTMAFEGKHGGQNRPEKTLAGFMIGTLTK